MYIKNAVVAAGMKLFNEKRFSQIQNEVLVRLVFFTAIKDYLYRFSSEEKIFLIPEDVSHRSSNKKIVLVLDMDETLVYTRRETKPNHYHYTHLQSDDGGMYIEPRPYAKQFLEAASTIFTIYVYTAGKKTYADPVLDCIDPKGLISKRFYRDMCRKNKGGLIKDLKHLKRSIKEKTDMVLVDDNTDSIQHNYPFAVKIKPFEGDQKDLELKKTFETLLRFYQ